MLFYNADETKTHPKIFALLRRPLKSHTGVSKTT